MKTVALTRAAAVVGVAIALQGCGPSSHSTNAVAPAPIPSDPDRFLAFLNPNNPETAESHDTATAYYAAVDPNNEKTTLDSWKSANGFDAGTDAFAVYQNVSDLGFGRRMFLRTNGDGSIASYVQNYPSADDAIHETNLIATVCMEYSAAPSGSVPASRYVKFFTYDKDGNRLLAADLDGRGAKFQPGVCNACHGGRPVPLTGGVYPFEGDTGARFLPWDLDAFAYSKTNPAYSRKNQEPQFKALNAAVVATYPEGRTFAYAGPPIGYDGSGSTIQVPIDVSGMVETVGSVVATIGHTPAGGPGIECSDVSHIFVELVSPSGERHSLAYIDSAAGANYQDAVFTEAGCDALLYATNPPYSQVWQQPRLQFFKGEVANGTWYIEVSGDLPATINAWSLTFNGTPRTAYTPAAVELINGWYGGPGLPGPFDGNFVPPGWLPPSVPFEAKRLYLDVIKPNCRACHVQRDSLRDATIGLATHAAFLARSAEIEDLVFDRGIMPMALKTYQRFWSDVFRFNPTPVETLAENLPNFSHRSATGAILGPGRPVARVGPSVTSGSNGVLLNGSGSLFALQYQWTVVGQPIGGIGTLSDATSRTPIFKGDVTGDYAIQLIVRNPTGASDPVVQEVFVDTSLAPVSFNTDILTVVFSGPNFAPVQGCDLSYCHSSSYGRNNPFTMVFPGDPGSENNYAHFRARVDFESPGASLVLTKPSNSEHCGGAIVGFTPADSSNYDLFLRWIMEGASDN